MIKNEYFLLADGNKIPKIGFGTWQINSSDAEKSVSFALKNGYLHIDTAIDYGNEVGVGNAIKVSEIQREKIFITSKIPAHIKTYDEAKKCIEESLNRLGLDYIDLMLIHSPRPWDKLWDNNAHRYYKENLEVYKALEEAYFEKKIKSIGLSNFFIDDVKNIIDNVSIKPVVNQVCVYIGNTPFELIDFCKSNNILIEAYSPIATGRLLNNKNIKHIADKYNVSIAKLCIKYCLEIGTLPLPKSTNESHIKDNLCIDFSISGEDLNYLLNYK